VIRFSRLNGGEVILQSSSFIVNIVRIRIRGEDFAAFFFFVKLYNRVFQEADSVVRKPLIREAD